MFLSWKNELFCIVDNFQQSSLVYLMLGNVNDDLGEMERTKYENVRKMAGSLFKDYEESLAGIYRVQLHENATRGFFMSLRCN